MKATGIVRRIDDLGRIVIPKEIRRTLKIRESDSLEIYTDREGEIILKKYSPFIEMKELAGEYVDALAKTTGGIVAATDRDYVIAVSSNGKKILYQKKISTEMENLLNKREKVNASSKSSSYIPIIDTEDNFEHEVIYPIIVEGDIVGSMVLLTQNKNVSFGTTEEKLLEFAGNFFTKQMEQ